MGHTYARIKTTLNEENEFSVPLASVPLAVLENPGKSVRVIRL